MVGYVVTQEFAKLAKAHYDDGIKAGTQSITHDWKHVYDVAFNAELIVRGEGGSDRDAAVAFIAGLLHDWCRKPEFKLKLQGLTDEHEKEGAEFARKLLAEWKYDAPFIEDVAKAIETHSFGISMHGDRNDVEPDTLPAMAIKAADKLDQCKPGIVWKRAAFVGETTGGNATDDEMLEYCRKRENKLREFLGNPTGILLTKHFYKAPEGLEFVKEFNDELEKEIAIAKKDPAASEFFNHAGALGIMRQGQKAGAQGKTTLMFKREFEASFAKVTVPSGADFADAAKFTQKMMLVRV